MSQDEDQFRKLQNASTLFNHLDEYESEAMKTKEQLEFKSKHQAQSKRRSDANKGGFLTDSAGCVVGSEGTTLLYARPPRHTSRSMETDTHRSLVPDLGLL